MITKHKSPEEDYAYLSGYLKAREGLFFTSETIQRQFQLFDLVELEKTLSSHRYPVKEAMEDPQAFENVLWGAYFHEVKIIRSLLPEEYLSQFIHHLHGVLFMQDEEKTVDLESKRFIHRFDEFMTVANLGTDMTRSIAKYVADRFNFLEQFRHKVNPESIPPYYQGGNVTEKAINQLIQSNFDEVDIAFFETDWMDFILQERPLKSIDFHFLNRFDIYWWHILRTFTDQNQTKAYGMDYIISYLLRFIREIELLKRIYIYAKYKLPTELLKEKLNNVL
jgi:vacuolar-type H+-ATPase subunit C/Vma6